LRIIAAFSALTADDVPEVPPVRGGPVVVDFAAERDKR
jgi:hypothetical protein